MRKPKPVAIARVIRMVQDLGLRPRGTSLYRKSNDGKVIQMVYVQSGRSYLTGKFTIEMGCFLPLEYRLNPFRSEQEPPAFPFIGDCQIRARISAFAGAGEIWWESNSVETISDLAPAIRAEIPRFFEQWGEVSAILSSWPNRPERTRLRVSEYAIAALLHEEHRDDEARELLEKIYAGPHGAMENVGQIVEFASKLGLVLRV